MLDHGALHRAQKLTQAQVVASRHGRAIDVNSAEHCADTLECLTGGAVTHAYPGAMNDPPPPPLPPTGMHGLARL